MEEQGPLLSDILDLNETYRAISRSKSVQDHALTTVRRSCSAENMPCEKMDDDRPGKTIKHRRKSLERKEEFTRENARKTRSKSIECSVDIDQLINVGSPRVVGGVTGSGLCLSFNTDNTSLPTPRFSGRLNHQHSDSGNELSITNKNNLNSVSWSKMQKGSTMPIYLKFSEIRYKVRGKGKNPSEMENILVGVTGFVDPGEILALMGPSGGGKTTLLNILSGRTNIKDQGGSVTYNDQPYSKRLKGRIGFVLQDDVAFPHLTVRETLTYTALLRLPNIQTKQQKQERAISVISELGLDRCQDMLIGGALVRGISGGERKRVCIGNEILLDPSLLFLDEPTSGLDSTTALRIAQMLQNIAQAGKTVVTTIHQPSSRLFNKFDKLILLGKGSSLYFGKASEAMLYFSSIGCSPLIAMNPAEFLIDLANGNINDKSIPSELTDKFSHGIFKGKHQDRWLSPTDIHEYLVGAYEIKVADAEKNKLLEAVPLDSKWETKGSVPREVGASWWEQYSILFWRGLKGRRHDYLSYVRVTQVLSTAVIIGLLWWHSDSSSPEKLQDQAGLLYFISVFWSFFPVFTSFFTFPQERAMLSKERSVDMYKLSAYFIARTMSDLALDLILPIAFLLIVYFMVGLKPVFTVFLKSMMSVLLCVVAAQGLGLAIGAALIDIKKATTLASIIIMTFMLAGGFFVERVPFFMSWIRYLSFNYHTYRLLLKIQYDCSTARHNGLTPCLSTFVEGLRTDNGGIEAGALIAMVFGYRLMAYLFLRNMKIRSAN